MSKGWIKLHRSLKDWEWYEDTNATRLLIHLLITVNYEAKRWKGQLIEPGTRITSWEHLAAETSLTVRQVRTAMSKLEKSGEVTRKATNKWQAITLVKWEQLQDERQASDKLDGRQVTGKRQANDKQTTTTKEGKNNKNYKKGKKEEVSLPWNSDEFAAAWSAWLDYKKAEKKGSYKTVIGEQSALSGLVRKSNNNESTAIEIIRNSIEQNYQGLFEIKKKPNANIGDGINADYLQELKNRTGNGATD